MIQVTTTAATTKDFKVLDQIIDIETQRKISKVKDAEHYGIMTACIIDGEFNLVSDYEVPSDMYEKLKNA